MTQIPQRTLTSYIAGTHRVPRARLKKIAQKLRCPISVLLPRPGDFSEPPSKPTPRKPRKGQAVVVPSLAEPHTSVVVMSGTQQQPLSSERTLIPVALLSIEPQKAAPAILTRNPALDVLNEQRNSMSEQQLGAWLALEACHLGQLLDAGWTVESILQSLGVLLQSIEGMPTMTRRKLLELGAAAMTGGIPVPTEEHVTEERRIQLTEALGRSIGEGWQLFNTASTPQVLLVGQALLHLLQQVHFLLSPHTRPLFFSVVYRLIGAGLFFSTRYAEALQAHQQSYVTALQIGDAWNMAESLAWQAGVWKACGKHDMSIQLTEEALRLVRKGDDTRSRATQARLLALWAESAALLHESKIATEKLDASGVLLSLLEPNYEFDVSTWHYYQGTCAFYLGDGAKADRYFEQALLGHYPTWILQRANTTLLQAEARLKMGTLEGSLSAAFLALPLVITMNSSLLSWGFIDYLQTLSTRFPHSSEIEAFSEVAQRQLALPAYRTVPRYLETKL